MVGAAVSCSAYRHTSYKPASASGCPLGLLWSFYSQASENIVLRILLRQLLLLLLRVLAIVGLVLLFAQPRWVTNLGSILGSSRTRHVVLLDDSYSMGEVLRTEASPDVPPTTAMTRGCTMIERLLEELVSTPGQQDFSLGLVSKLKQTSNKASTTDQDSSSSSDKKPEDNRFDIYTEIITPQNIDSARISVKKIRPSASTTQITPRNS